MRFVDTNVVLYALSTNRSERKKAVRAREVLTSHDLCLSTQVLSEFYVQATRAGSKDRVAPELAERIVTSFLRFPVHSVGAATVQAAIASAQRWQISFWDAAIIEAAREMGAEIVLSEDMQDGMNFGGVRVEDPFV